jgi:hypothetical protein
MDKSAQSRRSVPFKTPTGLGQEAVNDISAGPHWDHRAQNFGHCINRISAAVSFAAADAVEVISP